MTGQTMSSRNAYMLAIFVSLVMVGGVWVNVNIVDERLADAEDTADSLQRWADIDRKEIRRLKGIIDSQYVIIDKLQDTSFPMIELKEGQSALELRDIIQDNVQLRYDLNKKNIRIQDLKAEHDIVLHQAEDAYIELWMEHRELISLVVDAGISTHNCTGTYEGELPEWFSEDN